MTTFTEEYRENKEKGHAKTKSRWWPQVLAGGLVFLYIAYFSWLAISGYARFDLGTFDLGVYDSVVWNTLHGRLFYYTSTGQPLLHLSNHADPILALLAPLYLIHAGPETLLLLQAAVIGLGGLPVFWLAREKLGSDLAGLSLLIAYLLFPPLQVVTLSDFHPPALAAGFLMFAFYFLVKNKPGGVIIFSILAMSCKEQIPLIVIFMGLYAILRLRFVRLGAVLVGLGAAWFLVAMYWVIPAFSVTGEHIFLDYYSALGNTPVEIVVTAVTRPGLAASVLWQPSKLQYLLQLLAPFAFLPIIGLPELAIGLPVFAINLLSSKEAMHDASRGHYGADVAPWLTWGAVFGSLYLRRGLTRLWPGGRRWFTLTISLLVLTVSISWQVFHGFTPIALGAPRWEMTDHDRLADRFLDQIPDDASISSVGELYPHLSHRMNAYYFPGLGDAEYVLADVTVSSGSINIHPNDLKKGLDQLLESGQFGVLDAADGYLLLKRELDQPEIPDSFYGFARVAPDDFQPQYPVQVQFGDDLMLVGFDVKDDPRSQESSVRTYWQALRPIDKPLRLYPFFVNREGDTIEDTQLRPLITQLWYPPQNWEVGEIVAAETLPWKIGDEWSLAVGVLAGSDWADWNQRLRISEVEAPGNLSPRRFDFLTVLRLASFQRDGRQLELITLDDEEVQPGQPLQANFGDQMQLLGYDLQPEAAQAGQTLQVTLYWKALAAMGYNYTVFVHLVGPEGQRVAQHDGEPWWEMSLPTDTWLPGEVLRDRHSLEIGPDTPPGDYQLQIGVYYWKTGERLPVVQNSEPVSDLVELGTVTVK